MDVHLGSPHPPITNSSVQAAKQKRTRRPRVYKSQLDDLQFKYDIVKSLAIFGWVLWVATVLVVVVVQLSEI